MIIDIHSHIRRIEGGNTAETKLLADMEKHGIGYRIVSAWDGRSEREGISIFRIWYLAIRGNWVVVQ